MSDKDRSSFELVGQSPHMWLSSATQLKRAADLVAAELKRILAVYPDGRAPYQDLILFNSYMLLAGLSLESLAKGILIGKQPEVVGPDIFARKKIVNSMGGHDLTYLLRQVGGESQDELDLAKRLSVFVIWAGKYPIHLKSEATVSPSFATSDIEDVNSVFQRLANILDRDYPTPTIQFA